MSTTDHDPADLAARLRSTLARQAEAVAIGPEEDGLDDLHDRFTRPPEVPELPARRPRRTRLLRAAAVVAVLAAIGGAVAIRSRDGGGSGLQVAPEERTGFYVPTDLPDGWEVRAVRTATGPISTPCPCERRLYVDADRSFLVLQLRGWTKADDEEIVQEVVGLGGGVRGRWITRPSHAPQADALQWRQGPHRFLLTPQAGVSHGRVEAAARELVADRTTPPDGWLLRSSGRPPAPAVPEVQLRVATGDGSGLLVQLHPPTPHLLGDAGELPTLELLDLDAGPALRTPDRWGAGGYVEGVFDDATIRVGGDDLFFDGDPVSRRTAELDEYETMLRHLRPATAAEWAAFVRRVPGWTPSMIADRLAGVRSSVPLGIEVRTEPNTVTVESGRMEELTLSLRNVTNEDIDVGNLCAGRWGMAREDEGDPIGWTATMVDCHGKVVASGTRTQPYRVRATDNGSADGRPLPPGRYRFIIEDPRGRHRFAEVPVTVTPRVERDDDGPLQSTIPLPEGIGLPEDFSDISDLRLSVHLDAHTVVAGRSVGGEVRLRNVGEHDVDLTECTLTRMAWGLVNAVPMDDALPRRPLDHCVGLVKEVIRPAETLTIPLRRPYDGFVAREPAPEDAGGVFAGAVTPALYVAVVELPGRDGVIRARAEQLVEVTRHPCGTGLTDEMAELFEPRSPTLHEAREIAARHDLSVRVVRRDGEDLDVQQDLRCDRLDVETTTIDDLNRDPPGRVEVVTASLDLG